MCVSKHLILLSGGSIKGSSLFFCTGSWLLDLCKEWQMNSKGGFFNFDCGWQNSSDPENDCRKIKLPVQ
jgi:hypothetical protein